MQKLSKDAADVETTKKLEEEKVRWAVTAGWDWPQPFPAAQSWEHGPLSAGGGTARGGAARQPVLKLSPEVRVKK